MKTSVNDPSPDNKDELPSLSSIALTLLQVIPRLQPNLDDRIGPVRNSATESWSKGLAAVYRTRHLCDIKITFEQNPLKLEFFESTWAEYSFNKIC
jgi:hypothetical protein